MSNSGWERADETGKAARKAADLNAEILGAMTLVGPSSGVIEIGAGNFGLGHGDPPASGNSAWQDSGFGNLGRVDTNGRAGRLGRPLTPGTGGGGGY